MTPEAVFKEFISYVRINRSELKTRYSDSDNDRYHYNAYKFEFKGYTSYYMEGNKRLRDRYWKLKAKIHTPWGIVRARANYNTHIDCYEWFNTSPEVLLLYKLSRQ